MPHSKNSLRARLRGFMPVVMYMIGFGAPLIALGAMLAPLV